MDESHKKKEVEFEMALKKKEVELEMALKTTGQWSKKIAEYKIKEKIG